MSTSASPPSPARREFVRRIVGLGMLAAVSMTGGRTAGEQQPGVRRASPSPVSPAGTPSTPSLVQSSPTTPNSSATPAPPVTSTPVRQSAPLPTPTRPSASRPAPLAIAGVRQPSVLLITVDTMRADRIGAYGFASAKTPTLDRIAREGARFDHAICQMPQTNASHAALLTGLYPSTNGVKIHMVDKLPPGTQTMATVFQKNGYRTGAIYSWVSLDPQFCGLNAGFQTYDGYVLNRSLVFSDPRLEELAALYRQVRERVPIVKTADLTFNTSDDLAKSLDGRADVTTGAVLEWLTTHGTSDAFFLWVHYFDPHYPYTPPTGYDHVFGLRYSGKLDGSIDSIKQIEDGKIAVTEEDRARLGELYQGEIAFVDTQLGILFTELARRGIVDETIVVVTGDHGESFGEHDDWTHGMKVFESEIRVPLLIRYPPRIPAGLVVPGPVQLVDVMPTLFDLTGLRPSAPIQGTSLVPLIARPGTTAPRVAFTELADESFVSMLTADWKLIRNNANGELQLYRLSDDESELRNLARAEPRLTTELAAHLQDLLRISGVSH